MNLSPDDAMELGQLLQFLNDWLATGHGPVSASLTRFVGCEAYGVGSLRADLARFTFLLGESDGEGLFSPRTPTSELFQLQGAGRAVRRLAPRCQTGSRHRRDDGVAACGPVHRDRGRMGGVPQSQSHREVPWSGELRARLGPPGRPAPLASSPRSLVWQVDLAGMPAVVKQVVDGPGASGRYERELAALGLAARADPPVAPALLGADPGQRVLVLEWLSGRRPAADWVVGYAGTLARLHAVGTADDAGTLPRWPGPGGRDVAAFLGLAAALGAKVPSGVPGELDDLVGRLQQDQGHALLHGDPCPGNDLHTSDGVRFVDFERAALGSGLVELAYLRIGFPTCWCATAPPTPLLARAEAAYLAAWHAVTGTDAPGDLADACAGWLLQGDALVQQAHRGTTDYLALAVRRDWRWGTATARQRLAYRLGVVAQLTADSAGLAGLGQLSAGMQDCMLARWPDLAPLPASREADL